jgi:hypothetical protein
MHPISLQTMSHILFGWLVRPTLPLNGRQGDGGGEAES